MSDLFPQIDNHAGGSGSWIMEIHFMGQLHDSFEINARRNNQIPEIKICIGRQLKRASVRDKNDRAVVVKVTTDRERSSSQMAPHLATGEKEFGRIGISPYDLPQ